MTFQVSIPARLTGHHYPRFARFLQQMANRIMVGQARYGDPSEEAGYLRRLKRELRAYERTGNMEHLINVANWAYLESVCPTDPVKFHFDNGVGTVTGRYRADL